MTGRKMVLFSLLGGTAALAAVFFLWLYGTPGQYFLAERKCETQPQFTQSTLERVPDDYRDTAELRQYASALVMAEAGQYAEPIALLKELGDYRNAVSHWEELTYNYAVSLRDSGDYDGAVAAFESCFCGDYQTQILATKYEKAALLFREGEFKEAAEGFAALGEYLDSAVQRRSCLASLAVEKAETGDTEGGADLMDGLLAEAGEGEDYSDRAAAVYFARAETLMAEEAWAEAITRLDLCGAYPDREAVTEKREYCSSMLTYTAALSMMESGDYAGAVDLFDTIPGFLDADEYSQSCEAIAYKWVFTGYLSKDGTRDTETKTFVRSDTIYLYGTLSGGRPGRHINLRFTWVDAVGCTTDALVEDWVDGTGGGVTFSYSIPKNANIGKSTIYVYNDETGLEITRFTFTVKK